ncbi:MAG: AbiJ-NTD4 domain-containing protein [Hypericibacter sp.]
MGYFSDHEAGERMRDRDEIDESIWGGLRAVIRNRIEDGSFGAGFPDMCPDGYGPVGTDETSFWQVMRSEIPNLSEKPWFHGASTLPTFDALDTLEFCWRAIGKPIEGSYHSYFGHHHLSYDVEAGRAAFREAVNRIFRRNGLVFELGEDGHIIRLAPPVLGEVLSRASFRTGDDELDHLLEKSRRKFLDSDLTIRREALEALWDAWERLKTLGGVDKKTGITTLLDAAAGSSSPKFRAAIEQEAVALTNLGNQLRIRHSETDREPIVNHSHVDYLYHRLFALVLDILHAIGQRKA